MRALIALLMVLALLSAPVTLFGIGWGLSLIYEKSVVAFLVICASMTVSALGLAQLLDTRNPLPPRPPRDR